MKRYWEIDATRGLMLVLMTITHVPSLLTDPVGQPFGFVSAAEGFVLLSAFVSGLVYSRIGYTRGVKAMREAFWRRALKIYLIQALLLIFLFTVITMVGLKTGQPAMHELLKYYLAHPHEGLLYSLLLVYQPALLDILPLYILFMLLSPWVLVAAFRFGWGRVMAVSALLWLLAQFNMTPWLYEHVVAILGVPVPYNETGSFDTFAWQFLWFAGLWLGASRSAPNAQPLRFPPWLLIASVLVTLYCLYWRHYGAGGQAPFGDDMDMNTLLFDKWRLAPLRLVNLAAICIVSIRFGPEILARLPRPRALEAMGSASLSVFCAHLVVVLIVLATFGGDHRVRPWWGDVLLLAAVFALLYGVARAVAWWEARTPRPPRDGGRREPVPARRVLPQ